MSRGASKTYQRMSHHRRQLSSPRDVRSSKKGSALNEEGQPSFPFRENSVAKRVFPFMRTSSGNLKVIPDQVVYQSQKVSVIVADRENMQVTIREAFDNNENLLGSVEKFPQRLYYGQMDEEFEYEQSSSEIMSDSQYETEAETDLDIVLESLESYTPPAIDWRKISLPTKTDLFKILVDRITNNINPDFIIQISSDIFHCHLLVLQCYSLYFDTVKDVKQAQLAEKNVTPKAFSVIYNWMTYTKKENFQLLSRDNILEVFMASQFLGIKELEEQCWAFINSGELFSEDTAFSLYEKAREHGMEEIMELMLPRITKFFLKLVSTKNFVDLSANEVCSFLNSNYIAVHCEMEVFMSAVRWLMYDWENRKIHLLNVMQCIRWGLIAPWQLVDISRNQENPEFIEISHFRALQKLIADGLAFAIIKSWYGVQNEDYYGWIEKLVLEEPSPRNWIGEEKSYMKYKEFLKDLMLYRESDALEKMESRISQTDDIAIPPKKYKLPNSSSRPPIAEYLAMAHIELEGKYSYVNLLQSENTFKREIETGANSETQSVNTQVEESSDESLPGNSQITQEHKESAISSKPLNNSPCNNDNCSSTEIQNHELPVASENPSVKMVTGSFQLPTPTDQELDSYMPNNDKYQEVLQPKAQGNGGQDLKLSLGPEKIKKNNDLSSTSSERISLPVKHMKKKKVLKPPKNSYLTQRSLFFADYESVLVFGGLDPHCQYGMNRNTAKDIYRYQPEANIWECVGELPEPRHHHSVAFLRGRVYLAGGADPRPNTKGKSVAVSTMWNYDPVKRLWSSDSGMLTPRKKFELVANNGKLYSIGGQDRKGRILSSVELFDPNTGVWEEVAPLITGRMGFAAIAFRRYIWIAGGMIGSQNEHLTKEVECYDSHQNIWFSYTPLRFPICYGRFFSVNDCLFIIGSIQRKTENDSTASCTSTIDMWSESDSTWHPQAEMSIPRFGYSIGYLGEKIFIMGGVTAVYKRSTWKVDCFCCKQRTWIRGISNLPIPLTGQGSISLPSASAINSY